MSTLALFAAAGLITLGLRTGLVIAGAARPLPARFDAAFGLMPPAVFAAIVAGAIFVTDHQVEIPRLAELAAIGAGVLAVRRYDNVGFALAGCGNSACGVCLDWVVGGCGCVGVADGLGF